MGTDVSLENKFFQNTTNIRSNTSDFYIHPESQLIVRKGADVYKCFSELETQELEASLKMYITKKDLNYNDFDHATQIFSFLYLHASDEKKGDYIVCFNRLYEGIFNRVDKRFQDAIYAFRSVFLEQLDIRYQVNQTLNS